MGRQITLTEMIKECEDEANSKTKELPEGSTKEGDPKEILSS
tara:strand:- start:4189 stop:4314 length:126 start_codon:yes stop_codon:yes gene_type:complete